MAANSPFVILLVEDSDEDVFLLRRAIAKTGRAVAVQHVHNGVDAQHYLRGEGTFANRATYPPPRLVLSDFHLPLMSGLEFVIWMRSDPAFKGLPCIIYSGSANPSDVHTAYASGVTSFIVKPIDFQDWVTRLETVLKFWVDIAQSPISADTA